MCGRFTLFSKLDLIKILYDYMDENGVDRDGPLPEEWDEIVRKRQSYNIAPSQEALVVREHDGQPQFASLKWGLVPHWSKDLKPARKPINARAETAPESGMFCGAYKSRRCLVPTTGFYEWQKLDAKTKQPHFIRLKDERPFCFAGLWERWGEGGDHLETFTIITTTPNELMAPIHNRMPVILKPGDWAQWLDHSTDNREALSELMAPYPAGEMEAYPVSAMVNSPRNNRPECALPIEAVEDDTLF